MSAPNYQWSSMLLRLLTTRVMPAATSARPQAVDGCTFCRLCDSVCPEGLETSRLIALIALAQSPSLEGATHAERLDDLATERLSQCSDCGACTDACPSHLPLDTLLLAGKHSVAAELQEHEQSAHWRQRFERRQRRVATLALERRTRDARKLEPEQPSQQSEQPALRARSDAQAEVAAAVARVKAKRAALRDAQRSTGTEEES